VVVVHVTVAIPTFSEVSATTDFPVPSEKVSILVPPLEKRPRLVVYVSPTPSSGVPLLSTVAVISEGVNPSAVTEVGEAIRDMLFAAISNRGPAICADRMHNKTSNPFISFF
jgi:hypothetical protein